MELEWLTGPDAQRWLNDAGIWISEGQPILRVAKRLRKSLTAEQSAWVLDQAQLRIRARRKFSNADRMYFTRTALEQSTSEIIAAYKARRFASLARVADICCGIGGDLIALANGRPEQLLGLDMDPVVAAFAAANLRAHDLSAEVLCDKYEERAWTGWDGIHIDPDRRRSGKRTRAELLQPPLPEILERTDAQTALAIKLAPATPHHPALPGHAEREWIGHRRECKQQMVWMNGLQSAAATRTATVVKSEGTASFSVSEDLVRTVPMVAERLGRFLFEPHAVLLAAGLVDSFCEQNGLGRVADGIGYLTGDQDLPHPLLSRFTVVEILPLAAPKVAARLDQLDCGNLELKLRGIMEPAARPFRRYKPRGSQPFTVILTPTVGGGVAVICQRIDDGPAQSNNAKKGGE